MSTSKALLVENDSGIRLALRRFLEHRAFAVLEAVTGPEALVLAERHAPDLILLDLGLPNEDGLMVAQELLQRSRGGATPIGIFSAPVLGSDRPEILARIRVGPIQNPATLARLERNLKDLFPQRRVSPARRFHRAAVRIPARYRSRGAEQVPPVPGTGPYAAGVVRTLSEGGLMIELPVRLQAASLLELRLPAPDGEIHAAGKVVYSRPHHDRKTGTLAYQHGVRFVGLDRERRTILRQLLRAGPTGDR